ncbi:glycoside hydrolase family 16 protein [Frondihabitans cladoniiphilus]|uniref:GH16 domain-containing protein n=1 Tax=Frondihabitans cladoniiphilus TaxID=715785 RepID=A0ABP8VLL5_9MICO
MRLHRRATLVLATTLSIVGVTAAAGASAPAPAEAATSTAIPTGSVTSNGHTWTPVVSRDFTTNAALGSFTNVYGAAQAGYSNLRDTSGKGLYSPAKVLSAQNGNLDYYLHTASGQPLVAAYMPNGYTGQTYGRYAVRLQADNLPGYKVAFNLWPTSNNWNQGEIDWPDGGINGPVFPASAIAGSYNSSTGSMSFDKPPTSAAPTMGTGWHDYVIEWSPGHVRWYFDGTLVGQTTNPSGVPTQPLRWTLQAETNLEGKTVAASTAGHLRVAWAVQYKY